ncbi:MULTISPECIES: glycosyltransferase [unclassified Methylophilus]|jgi:1,2-diacylglycerol 3-alpha-glucosyltransferase|uniref:glycosyltransferase n=1 Tax=unclassified Methylophilus TaxID=2630143 RepID=UPI000A6C9BAD|nr:MULTISPECIES: glycosyltransferase [unclassified Methylophilus]
MKILMISDVYFPRVNGVSTSIRTFAESLRADGHSVHLIAPQYAQSLDHALIGDEAWITRIDARKIVFDPEDYLMKWSALVAYIESLHPGDYDMVHIHTPFIAHYAGLKIAKKLQVPVLETYHTFFEDYMHHYLPWVPRKFAVNIAQWVSRKQCQQVDTVVSPSGQMRDVLQQYGVTTPITVIPTGLDASRFVPGDGAAFREKYGIPAQRPLLMFVGRVAHEKNIQFLLEMLSLVIQDHPEVLLVITGEGPAEAMLKKMTKDNGLQQNVMFLGYLDRAVGLNAAYRAADIFVFASKSETQGLVLLEAMAQETPVVAIAELGTASILRHEQGALIAQDDELHFAEQVQTLLIDHQLRERVGKNGKRYVEQVWSSEAQAKKLLECYERLMLANFPLSASAAA